ncbi:MAG TPA: molybdopterin-dependent oxidoreductase [Solirubrobacteraceae bacterium]|nr:molybdopterin-dependent oxidoreductase [Solirubrobacteraceae bacterium]
MRSFTRRRFVQGTATAAGLLTVAGGLRYLEDTPEADAGAVAGTSVTFRTGHSNNCDGACGHLVTVVDGKVRLIEGAPWDQRTISGQRTPRFDARTCLRGNAQIQNTYSPDRLKYPYQRVGERGSGRWRRIGWDDATGLIAANFERVQKRYGKKSVWIAPYTGSLALLEGVVGAGFRFASVIGASAGDFEGDNEGDSATPAGWNYVLADPDLTAGGIFDGHEMTDFLNAKVIVLWANNVAETSIPDWRIIADAHKNGTKVVSIDPRYTPTSAKADLWLPIRPGADTALIDGILNYAITNRRYDAAYVKQYTVGPFLVDPHTKHFMRKGGSYLVVDAADGQVKPVQHAKDPDLFGEHQGARSAFALLADEMAPYTPQKVASMTDLDPAQVVTLAQLWTQNHPVAVRAGFALSHWYRGDLTMQALVTLQALTGNIGVHGGGITTFAGGLTTTAFDLPGFWAPKGTQMYTVLEPMEACDAMLENKPYPVRAAWFMVDNYAQQMSDRNKVIRALKSLDFLVVSDYVMSATADLADIVLPACTYLEKTDLLSSNNYYLQYMPKVIEPLWESKSDLDAISLVAGKMGYGKYFTKTPDQYLQDMLHIGDPNADANVKGLKWKQVTDGAPHLNTPTVPYVAFFDKTFPTKSGRIEFYVERMLPYDQQLPGYKEPIEATPTNPLYKKYPLTFLSTHTRFRTHSQFVNLPWLKEINNGGEGFLEINPVDAKPRGIKTGDVVAVFNDRGSMKVKARLTEGIKPGVVNCYQGGWDTIKVKHYIEGHPNNLTHQLANPAQSVIPNFRSNAAYYDCLVEVKREGA